MELGLLVLRSIGVLLLTMVSMAASRSVAQGQLLEQRGNALVLEGNSTVEAVLPPGGSWTTSRILQSLRDGFLAEGVEVANLRLGQDDDSLNFVEGRKFKKGKRMFLRMLILVKILAGALVVPAILGLTALAAWKGITISLLAFTIASLVGLKSLFGQRSNESSKTNHHVIVTKLPSHHDHVWRMDSDEYQDQDDLPYRGHVKWH